LGEIVKTTKLLKSAKTADLAAVKTALENAVKYTYDEQPA